MKSQWEIKLEYTKTGWSVKLVRKLIINHDDFIWNYQNRSPAPMDELIVVRDEDNTITIQFGHKIGLYCSWITLDEFYNFCKSKLQ